MSDDLCQCQTCGRMHKRLGTPPVSVMEQIARDMKQEHNARLVAALNVILDAEKEFREQMGDDWQGDPLHDACEAARDALAQQSTEKP